jgi:putative glutamine amidotransferase
MLAADNPTFRVAIYGPEEALTNESRGCNLWPLGYAAALTAAGAAPVQLSEPASKCSWGEVLRDIDALVWTGRYRPDLTLTSNEERLCRWCRKHRLPLLAVDEALHALNSAFGGTLHLDLSRERPEALQHRQPPERGLRHAIEIVPGTHLAEIYGEGELVVNSEHRRGVARVARGFRESAKALDGIIEAIEAESANWYCLAVQWRPAAATASGLDIQLFRGLIEASRNRTDGGQKRAIDHSGIVPNVALGCAAGSAGAASNRFTSAVTPRN